MCRIEDEAENYVSRKSINLKHGVIIWRNGDVYWVLTYPFTIFITMSICSWVAIYHISNYDSVSFVGKLFEYNVFLGGSLFAYTIYCKSQSIQRVSRILDKCWKYSYLQKEKEELIMETENTVEKICFIYYNCKCMIDN